MSQQEAEQLGQQQGGRLPTAEVIKSPPSHGKTSAAHSAGEEERGAGARPQQDPWLASATNLISRPTIVDRGGLRSSEPHIQIARAQIPYREAGQAPGPSVRSSMEALGSLDVAHDRRHGPPFEPAARIGHRWPPEAGLQGSGHPSAGQIPHPEPVVPMSGPLIGTPSERAQPTKQIARQSSAVIDFARRQGTLKRAACLRGKTKGFNIRTKLLEASTDTNTERPEKGTGGCVGGGATKQPDERHQSSLAGCERFVRVLGHTVRSFFVNPSQSVSVQRKGQTSNLNLEAKRGSNGGEILKEREQFDVTSDRDSGGSGISVSNSNSVLNKQLDQTEHDKISHGSQLARSSVSCQSINTKANNHHRCSSNNAAGAPSERIKSLKETRDCVVYNYKKERGNLRKNSVHSNKWSSIKVNATLSSPALNNQPTDYTCCECLKNRTIAANESLGRRRDDKLSTGSRQSLDRGRKALDAESSDQSMPIGYLNRKRRSTNCSWSVATNTDYNIDSSTSSVNNCSAAGCHKTRTDIQRDKMDRGDSLVSHSDDLDPRADVSQSQAHLRFSDTRSHQQLADLQSHVSSSSKRKSCADSINNNNNKPNDCELSKSTIEKNLYNTKMIKNDYRISMSSKSKLSTELTTNYEPKLNLSSTSTSLPIRKRENWDKKIEFLLAVIGFAVDLGNVWRFPYVCFRNGGGAFLIPYTIMFLLGGLPIFYLEMALGQYFSSGCLTIWKRVCPMAKGIGYAMCVLNFYTGLYYNTIISWAVFFFVESFTNVLPWTSCKNEWNTKFCKTIEQRYLDRLNATNKTLNIPDGAVYSNLTDTTISSPTKDYYEREVLRVHLSKGIDDLGTIRAPLALYLALVFICIYFAIWKGVKSTGKAVWITALLPYFVLIPLLFRGIFLEGAWLGIEYYLSPDWPSILNPKVWVEAAKQIYFSLGPGFGTLMALSSYNVFNHNCRRDALIAAAVNYFASFISGLVIFAVLGYMATLESLDINEVATEGPGLVFQVYPEGLAQMSFSPLWSILFFAMVITLGIDSTFGGLESVITGLCDEYPRLLRENRGTFIGLLIVLIYLCSLPTTTYGGNYVIYVMESYGTSFSLLFIVLLETIIVCWVYGADRFCKNLEEMSGKPTGLYWRVCWKYISPTILLIIFLAAVSEEMDHYHILKMGAYVYPGWAPILGILMTASSISCIPLFAIYYIKRKTSGTLIERLKMACTPIESNESGIRLQQNMGVERPT